MYRIIPFLLLMLTSSQSAFTQTFTSPQEQTHLIELYSSQGCSSCPPAERWISSLRESSKLWKSYIPLVFHVDYWNYLGWKDPFSQTAYSLRQRTYKQQGLIKSVYTPGFIVNGNEWRGWVRQKTFRPPLNEPGVLTANLSRQTLNAHYKSDKPLILNVAILGFDLHTQVLNGENKGRNFTENFIVLDLISRYSNNGQWDLKIMDLASFKAERYALAIWINDVESLLPIQATGGWIDN